MTLKLGMQHRILEYMYYQICSNVNSGLTLSYFRARSNLIPYAFVWEKGKTMDFSETIVFYIKVERCSQPNEYMNVMKLYEYQRSTSFIVQGHSETARMIEANFHVELPWDKGMEVSINALWLSCPYMIKIFSG